MNTDNFESRLQALRRSPPPQEWKSSILAAALQAEPRPVGLTPPRWLACTLATVWVLILTLHLLTPYDPSHTTIAPSPTVAGGTIQQRNDLWASLLASQSPTTP